MGGAMDLAAGPRPVVEPIEHVAKDGAPKPVTRGGWPRTGAAVVAGRITGLAAVDRIDRLPEWRRGGIAPGITLEEVKARTTAQVIV